MSPPQVLSMDSPTTGDASNPSVRAIISMAAPMVASGARVARRWVTYLAVLLATAFVYFTLATAFVSRVVPLMAGWDTSTIMSGSMSPTIHPGDVLAYAPYRGTALVEGTIIVFEDPGRPDVLVAHRVFGVNTDGTYVTKGDANPLPDSTPVPSDHIRGVARLVSPLAGLPFYWASRHEFGHLLLFLLALTAGVLTLGALRQEEPSPDTPDTSHDGEDRGPLRRAALVPVFALIGVVLMVGASLAAFSSTTSNPGNAFAASSTFDPGLGHAGSAGTATCGGTGSTIVVSSAIPAGNTVVVQIALRDPSGALSFGAADSGGNTYQVDGVGNDGSRSAVAILSAQVSTPLAAGDSISVSHPANNGSAVRADVYTGIAPSGRLVASGSASGNSKGASVTVGAGEANTLAVGVVVTRNNSTITQPGGWSGLQSGNLSCSQSFGRASAWAGSPAPTTYGYDPTFGNSNERWSAVVVVYRAG